MPIRSGVASFKMGTLPEPRCPIMKVVLLAACLATLLTGCEVIPRDSPDAPSGGDRALSRYADIIALAPNNIDPYRVVAERSRPTTARAESTVPEALLSAGDSINVRIYESREQGLFGTAITGGTNFGPLYISPDGTVDIPFAGRLSAAGMSLAQLAAAVKKKVARVSFQPEVVVTFQTEQTSTITVSGDVKAPGRYPMLDGIRTALDAVDRAGGASAPPYQVDVVLRRADGVTRISLWDVINGGDFPLRGGDDLVLQDTPRFFTGLGAVTKSGRYPLPSPDTNLIDALGMAGGLVDLQADRTGIIVFRENATGADAAAALMRLAPGAAAPATTGAGAAAKPGAPRPTFFTLDFSKPISLVVAQKFRVRPGDVIYVTNAPTVDLNKYLLVLLRAAAIGRLIGSGATTVAPGD
jgi:polysaccharide biosynthesis/export protein